MSRLPAVGGDNDDWGTILNDFLSVEHNADGTLKTLNPSKISGTAEVQTNKGATGGYASLDGSGNVPLAQLGNAPSAADATTLAKGVVQLAGDLAGTAANPTVPDKIDKSTLTAKGDILAATGSAAVSRLGVGSDGQVLTADSSQSTGIKWSGVSDTLVTVAASDTPAAVKSAADYACTGTGDEVTINTAIAALTNGGTVQLLAGTFNISSSIVFTAVKQRLIGAGMGATTIQGNGTNVGTFVKPTAAGLSQLFLSDLKIITTVATTGTGFDFSDTANCYVDNVRVEDCALGMNLDDNSAVTGASQTFYHSYRNLVLFNTDNCIKIGTGANSTQPNMHQFYNIRCRPRTGGAGAGLTTNDVRGLLFNGLDVEPGTGTGITGVKLLNSTGASREITFVNCWLEGNDTNASIASGSARISFIGGTITAPLTTNISDSGTNTTFLNINNNASMKNQLPSPTLIGATSGIYSGSGSPEGVITANVGSAYLRTDGAAGTSYYVKETGSGNTGWTAVVTSIPVAGGTADNRYNPSAMNDISTFARETFDRQSATINAAMVTGIYYFHRIRLVPGSYTTARVWLDNTTTAGCSNLFFGLHNSSLAKVAASADVSASFNGLTTKQFIDIPMSYTVASEAIFYIGMLVGAATTPPTLAALANLSSGFLMGQNASETTYPLIAARHSAGGLTAVPDPITLQAAPPSGALNFWLSYR